MTDLEIWTLVLNEWNEAVTNPRYFLDPVTRQNIFVTFHLHEGICHSLQRLAFRSCVIDRFKYSELRAQLPGQGVTFCWPKTLEGAQERVKWLTEKIQELQ